MPPSDREIRRSNSFLSRFRRSFRESFPIVPQRKLTPSNLDYEDEAITKSSPSKAIDPSNRYRMVALDLDRTLLASNGTLADVQADYLRDLHQKGFRICLATGRAAASTLPHAAKLQIPRLPIVCSNGSSGYIWNGTVGEDENKASSNISPSVLEEQFQLPVPKSIVQRTLKLASKHGFCLQYYYQDSIYANPTTELHKSHIQKYGEIFGVSIQTVEDDFIQELLVQNHLPSKLLLLFDSKDNLKVRNVIHDEFHSSEAHIVRGNSTWLLQILSPTANKGIGLQTMCRKLDIPLDQVIAIGDSFNDLEFLQMAGLGVAVQNAEPEIKTIADINLEFTNDQHGPMRLLQELDNNGQLIFQEATTKEDEEK